MDKGCLARGSSQRVTIQILKPSILEAGMGVNNQGSVVGHSYEIVMFRER